MKILWINSMGLDARTAINRTKPLSQELRRLGHDVDMPSVKKRIYGDTNESSQILTHFFKLFRRPLHCLLTRARSFMFPVTGFEDIFVFYNLLIRYWKGLEYDVIIVSKPNLGGAGAGLLLAKKNKIPLILDLDDYDIHPDNPLLLNFDGLIVASRKLRSQFEKYSPAYIPNSTDLDLFNPSNYRSEKKEPPRVVWSGLMGRYMNFSGLLNGFELMKEDGKLMFMGRGPGKKKVVRQARSLDKGDDVIFSEWLDRTEVPRRLYESSIGILYLTDTLFQKCKCPGKLFEYMAMELPVVSTDVGEASYVIREAECGVLVPPDDPQSLSEALDNLVRNPNLRRKMGQNGREFLINHQNYNLLGSRLNEYISKIVERN